MSNAKEAITPREKFINYSLNPDNPNAKGKAEAYEKGLGYTRENAEGLYKAVAVIINLRHIRPKFSMKERLFIEITRRNGIMNSNLGQIRPK